MIALLYAGREIHPFPAGVMLSVVLTGGVAWIPLLPMSLKSFSCFHQLILFLSSCSWSEVLRQFWTMVSQPWGSHRRNVISPWILTPFLSLREGCTPGSPVLEEPFHFFMQSLLWSHSTPLCPLQCASQCTHPPTQQAAPSEEEEKLSAFQYKGFLPQTVPVRSNSAPCLTSSGGFITCGTV